MRSRFTPLFTPHTQHHGECIGFCGHTLITRLDGTLACYEELQMLSTPLHHFDIAHCDEKQYSLMLFHESLTLPEHLIKTPLRGYLTSQSETMFSLLSRAQELVHWLQDNRFCGQCGTPTHYDASMSTLKCPKCGHLMFPRLSPACIVLVTHHDKILLARSPHFPEGLYSTLAGFVEAGESAEEAAHREVLEESNIHIKNLRYFGTQPWPFPHSLMIGFFAEYDSGEIAPQEEEIEDVQWFTKENLPTLPHEGTIARKMIDTWLKNH